MRIMQCMNTLPTDALSVENFVPRHPSLRIALVTETYPPEVNGVALTLERLVRQLQSRGHHVQLVRPRQTGSDQADSNDNLQEVLMRGMPIPRYPNLRMGLPAKKTLTSMWMLRRPDIVHIATEGPLGWSALQAARKLRLPISSDFRTNFHAYSNFYGVGWLRKSIAAYLRKFHNLADCTMVPTPALQRELQSCGFQRLLQVARGVDTLRFNPTWRCETLRAQWGALPDTPVALSVGRLAPEKNPQLLVRAYHAMKAANPATRLVVVGDGPGRDALQAQCPDAVMAGVQTGNDLARCYASADLFLFPSLTETYGNVVPEALASGLAVLAFDYAAAHELIRHGENGLLAPCTDNNMFAGYASDLVGNPALAQLLRRRARESTLALSWERIAEQIEGIWGVVLRDHAAMHGAMSGHRLIAQTNLAQIFLNKNSV